MVTRRAAYRAGRARQPLDLGCRAESSRRPFSTSRAAALVVGVLMAAGGSSCASASPVALPTTARVDVCPASRHAAFVLAVDARERPPVWGVDPNGRSFSLIWPDGFTLQGASILDEAGVTIASNGHVIDDAMGAPDASGAFVVCGIAGHVYVVH